MTLCQTLGQFFFNWVPLIFIGSVRILKLVLFLASRFRIMLINVSKVPGLENCTRVSLSDQSPITSTGRYPLSSQYNSRLITSTRRYPLSSRQLFGTSLDIFGTEGIHPIGPYSLSG